MRMFKNLWNFILLIADAEIILFLRDHELSNVIESV